MTAPSLARILTDVGAFVDEPFTLIDVGCSGGIFSPALEFTPSLKAVGFDPITDEVERLQATTPDEGVRFECALVDEPGWELPIQRNSPGVFARSSATAYGELHAFDYSREVFNTGRAITLTDHRIALRDWLSAHPDWTVDLLKVDTDGSDISVLRSMGDRIGEPLAVHVEVNFDGDVGPDRNVFSTVFDTLVKAGYRLFSLDPTRYAKAAMPRPFQWQMPAQTSGGQVMQADALFCRDLAVEGEDTPTRMLKLACIFDLLDLQDCAAELLESHQALLEETSPVPVSDLLAALGPRTELGLAPADARDRLRRQPEEFFPESAGTDVRQPEEFFPEPAGTDVQRHIPLLHLDGQTISLRGDAKSVVTTEADGWWPPEMTGTWTAGACATLPVRLEKPLPSGTIIEIDGWRLDTGTDEHVGCVVINGVALKGTINRPTGPWKFVVPREISRGSAVIAVHSWPLARPITLGLSMDERLLGTHIASLRLRSEGARY